MLNADRAQCFFSCLPDVFGERENVDLGLPPEDISDRSIFKEQELRANHRSIEVTNQKAQREFATSRSCCVIYKENPHRSHLRYLVPCTEFPSYGGHANAAR